MARKPIKNVYNGSRKYTLKIDETTFGGVRRRRANLPKIKAKKSVAAAKVTKKTIKSSKKIDNKNTVKLNKNVAISASRSPCLTCNPCDTNDRLHRIENFFIILVILVTIIVTIFAQNKIQSFTQRLNSAPVKGVSSEEENHSAKTGVVHETIDKKEVTVVEPKNIQDIEKKDSKMYRISLFNFFLNFNECITMNKDYTKADGLAEVKQEQKLSDIAISEGTTIKIDVPSGLGKVDGIIIGSSEALDSLFEAVENKEDKKSSKSSGAFMGGNVSFLIPPAAINQNYGNNSMSFSQSSSGSSSQVINARCIPSTGSMAILGMATLVLCHPVRSR